MGKAWNRLKKLGNEHYRSMGGVQPIDLMKDSGIIWNFNIGNIIKYAYRNRDQPNIKTLDDMDKIIHYCKMLKVIAKEGGIEGNEKGRNDM